ncbi:MAG: hypothetical protein HY590_04465 [Candidatus Omnitrophica bacterium]|nr:hypothetical protein [Candidatus Omnitrophota bacterium]
MMGMRNEKGFILPLAVLLVLVLTISGTGFMHLDYLERRMGMNEVDNHGAFYLGNAGIERARETFKVPSPDFTWTSMLQDPSITDSAPFCLSADPDSCLCPPDLSRGCIIPPFQTPTGNPVISPDMPFVVGVFDDGEYTVRAFNNESSTIDTDQQLTFRALGTVRGEKKLLETTVLAISNLNLINCGQPPCPTKASGNPTTCDPSTNPSCDPADGREPAAGPLPSLISPLTDPNNYHRIPANFGLASCSYSGTLSNGCHYVIPGDVTLHDQVANNVVIFSEGEVTIGSNVNLTNAVIIGVNKVTLSGGGADVLSAMLPHPIIISGGNVSGGNASFTIFGTVFAVGSIDANPVDFHGVLIGDPTVEIQGVSHYTDDHDIDPNYLKYYAFMPGFTYGPELITTTQISGTWREVE